MDFAERLNELLNKLDVAIPSILGTLKASESSALTPMPGGQVVRAYMDGEADKRLIYQYAIKCKAERIPEANDQLWRVTTFLEGLESVKSSDGSFQFDTISLTSQPAQSNADEAGFYYFTVEFSADLTTFPMKEEQA